MKIEDYPYALRVFWTESDGYRATLPAMYKFTEHLHNSSVDTLADPELDRELLKVNAVSVDRGYINFKTEEDRFMFLLKWS